MSHESTALITLDGVSVGYHGQPILTDITLSLHYGRLAVLFGSNGSGKSTILKTLVGILPLITGNIHYHNSAESSRFNCGYVPQGETLDAAYPLSAKDVVLMGILAYRSPLQRTHRTHHLAAIGHLAQVGLIEHSDRLFATLSVGQKRRVLIARALATQPNCLVMDEPTSGVDRESARTIFKLLENLKRIRNLSILVVSHRAEEIVHMADTVIRIEQGRLVIESPPKLDEI